MSGSSAKPRRHSAGILVYRLAHPVAPPVGSPVDALVGSPVDALVGSPVGPAHPPVPCVLLGHMGGPLWSRRDAGAWSIPKGGYTPEEDAFAAARREYVEEVGLAPPEGRYLPLGEVLQSNNKVVTAWAVEGEVDPSRAASALFELEWPPGSGRLQSFPEFDRVAWFDVDEARTRIVAAQATFLDRLAAHLAGVPAREVAP